MISFILILRKHVKLSWRTMSQKMKRKTWTWIRTCRTLVSVLLSSSTAVLNIFTRFDEFSTCYAAVMSVCLWNHSPSALCDAWTFPLQAMRKRRAAAVRLRTLAVNLTGTTKTVTKGETMTKRRKTEGREGGRPAPVEVKAARREPERCETRRRSSEATTTATTTSPRTRPGAAGTRAAGARMKVGTEEAAEAAVHLRHTATAAVTAQRPGLRVEVEATEAPSRVMPVIVIKTCGLDSLVAATYLICMFTCKHWWLQISDETREWDAQCFQMWEGRGGSLYCPVFRYSWRASRYLYTTFLVLCVRYLIQYHVKMSLFSQLWTCHYASALKLIINHRRRFLRNSVVNGLICLV